MPLPPDLADAFAADHAAAQHHDQVLAELEARAADGGERLPGRAVGRHLELLARSIGARRVLDLDTGTGYAAYWLSRAVSEVVGAPQDDGRAGDGEVVALEADPERARVAESSLRRAGRWDPVRVEVGDPLTLAAATDGLFDLVHVGGSPTPAGWAVLADRVRVLGLYVCTRALGDGDAPDEATVAHDRAVATDPRFVSSVLPLRDGVLVALRTE